MHVRDEEIKRLIHYAKGLGVKVIIYNKNHPDADAEWCLDGSMIQVYAGPGNTKTDIILHLIHELGHHKWFIEERNRQIDLKFDEAITRENLFQVDYDNPTPKHLRKKIYDTEVAGTQFWHSIYKDTDIKIPIWKLEASMEFDMWMYEVYYETGLFPKSKACNEQYTKIQKKHNPKKSGA